MPVSRSPLLSFVARGVTLGAITVGLVASIGCESSASVKKQGLIRAEATIKNTFYGNYVGAVYVNHTYKIDEAMTDEGWAKTLLQSRYVGNRSGVERAYGMEEYKHFDPPVKCKVVPQEQRGPMDPITCVVQNGEMKGQRVYASDILPQF